MKRRLRLAWMWLLLRALIVCWFAEGLWRWAWRRELEFFMVPLFVNTKANHLGRQVTAIARRNSPEGQRALAAAKAKREKRAKRLRVVHREDN